MRGGNMKAFLSKVNSAINSMGKSPYDDKKTMDYIEKETEKTIKYYEQLRKNRVDKK
jgi:hypothetical protein